MQSQLDDLAIALYVDIDDALDPLALRRGAGRPVQISDSELVCLATLQVLLGINSERRWLRVARQRLGHLFPRLPDQSTYNRRLRAAGGMLAHAIAILAARTPSWHDQTRLLDSTPVPCGSSRETAKRSELRGWANYGYCAAHSRYFWGLRLYLFTTPDGIPTAWCLADPKLGEREVAEAMFEHTPPRPGMLIVADKGFAGREFAQLVTDYGATLLRPQRRDESQPATRLGWIRQRIESVNWSLKGQLGLEEHGGRTPAGVFARVAQRLLALTAAIWHNWLIHAPCKRSLLAYEG